MVSIPLEWTLSVKGGSQVKSTMNDLDSAFKRGQISQDDYNSSLSQLNRTALRGINVNRYRNNILLAEYPNLLRVSRALSTVTSITRTLLTISNALNLSKIAGQGVDTESTRIQTELNKEKRLQNELEKQGLKGSKEWILSKERENILLGEQRDHIQQIKDQNFNEWLTTISSLSLITSTSISAMAKSFGVLKAAIVLIPTAALIGLSAILTGISSLFSSSLFTGGLAFFASQLLGLIPGMNELRKSFHDWLKSIGTLDATWLDKGVTKFFRIDMPLAIGNAGIALTQFFLTDLPNWASNGTRFVVDLFGSMWAGIQDFFTNGFQFITNQIIKFWGWIQKFAADVVSLFKSLSFGGGSGGGSSYSGSNVFANPWGINTTPKKSATGFDGMVNGPTMFLAGEAGPEQVSITPGGRNSANGGGNTVIINVAGSVITEKRLAYIVDQYQKQNLKSRGFTGFG